MTDHDPMCTPMPPTFDGCWACDLIANVRADANLAALDAFRNERRHAETVAARLVEVICEQERALASEAGFAAMRAERDAAHAEARIMTDQNARLLADIDAARAEVAALREDPSGENWPLLRELWRREVLADLRAKVDQIPQQEHDGWDGLIDKAEVLALIDEAAR